MAVTPADARVRKLEAMVARLRDTDKAIFAYPLLQPTVRGAKLTFRGLTSQLTPKRIGLDVLIADTSDRQLLSQLRHAALEQRRLHEIRKQGFLIELPIKAAIAEIGISASELVEKIRDLNEHPLSTHAHVVTAMHIDGVHMNLKISNGVISGMVELGNEPFTQWESGYAKVDGLKLPKTMQSAMTGKTVTDIVEHRWLKGLTVSHASGKNHLALKVAEKPVPAGAHDVI